MIHITPADLQFCGLALLVIVLVIAAWTAPHDNPRRWL